MERAEVKHEAWVVAVDMGYGHQRAAYPLRFLSPGGVVINANNYPGITKAERRQWVVTQKSYEFVSRLVGVPVIGQTLFNIMDHFQEVPPLYPKRDLSKPTFQLRQTYSFIRRGLGKDLIKFLNTRNIPLITTFFTAAFIAEEHNFNNEIYLQICDSDISRAWAPLNPQKSRIKYLAPCQRVVERLKCYGVRSENIFLTGFPLPEENIGTHLEILHADLAVRLSNLDPEKKFRAKYGEKMQQLSAHFSPKEPSPKPATITFAVGGAGAQRAIALAILKSIKPALLSGTIALNLVAGVRKEIYNFFKTQILNLGLESVLGRNITIIFEDSKEKYFAVFNEALRTTDVLWTKPSELVFYSALGLPIIMSPSVGSQEKYNRTWLKTIGAGITQGDPAYTNEWLFDWINSGWLAEAALSGYLDRRQFGVRNIVDVVFNSVTKPAIDAPQL